MNLHKQLICKCVTWHVTHHYILNFTQIRSYRLVMILYFPLDIFSFLFPRTTASIGRWNNWLNANKLSIVGILIPLHQLYTLWTLARFRYYCTYLADIPRLPIILRRLIPVSFKFITGNIGISSPLSCFLSNTFISLMHSQYH